MPGACLGRALLPDREELDLDRMFDVLYVDMRLEAHRSRSRGRA